MACATPRYLARPKRGGIPGLAAPDLNQLPCTLPKHRSSPPFRHAFMRPMAKAETSESSSR